MKKLLIAFLLLFFTSTANAFIGKNGYPIGWDEETLTAWQDIYANKDDSVNAPYWEKAPKEVKVIASGDLSFFGTEEEMISYLSWGTNDPTFVAPFGGIDNVRANFGRRMLSYASVSHLLTEEQRIIIESGYDRVINYLVFERNISSSMGDSDLILSSMGSIALYYGLIKDRNPARAEQIMLEGNTGGLESPGEGITFRKATHDIFAGMNPSGSDGVVWIEGTQYSTGTRNLVMPVFRVLKEILGEEYFPEVLESDEACSYGHIQWLVNDFRERNVIGDAGGDKLYANFNYIGLPEISADYGRTKDPVLAYIFDQMVKKGDRTYLNKYTGFEKSAVPSLPIPTEEYFNSNAPRYLFDANKGLTIWRSGWTMNDVIFMALLANRGYAEHWPYYDNLSIWRKGEWVLDYHRGYSSASFDLGWGNALYPWGGRRMKENKVVAHEKGEDYFYSEGVSFGNMDNIKWTVNQSVYEHSRAVFGKQNDDNSTVLVVFDRLDVNDKFGEDEVSDVVDYRGVTVKNVPKNFTDFGNLIWRYYQVPPTNADYRHEINWVPNILYPSDLITTKNGFEWGNNQKVNLEIFSDNYTVSGPYMLSNTPKYGRYEDYQYPNISGDANSQASNPEYWPYANLRIRLNQKSGFQTFLETISVNDKDEEKPLITSIKTDKVEGVKVKSGLESYAILFSKVQGERSKDKIIEKRYISEPINVDLTGIQTLYMANLDPTRNAIINGISYDPNDNGFLVVNFSAKPDPSPTPNPVPIPDPNPQPSPDMSFEHKLGVIIIELIQIIKDKLIELIQMVKEIWSKV